MASHKEITASVRKGIKDIGIKALVKMDVSCGSRYVRIDVPKYGLEFSVDEQQKIKRIAIAHSLTFVRGIPICIDQNTDPYSFNLYI